MTTMPIGGRPTLTGARRGLYMSLATAEPGAG